MESNSLSLILLLVSLAVLATNIFLIFRVNLLKYLLQKPIIQKMSPSIQLKPRSLDGKEKSASPAEAGVQNRNRPPHTSATAGNPNPSNNNPNRHNPNGGNRKPFQNNDRKNGQNPRNRNGRGLGRNGLEANEAGQESPERGSNPGTENSSRPNPREFRPHQENSSNPGQNLEAVQAETNLQQNNQAPKSLPAREPKIILENAPIQIQEEQESSFLSSNESIAHGRRVKVKKKPSFEEIAE